jgi:hypothetical protein
LPPGESSGASAHRLLEQTPCHVEELSVYY